MKKLRETVAFTLAELLIVIAIIAILVAIAIPVFSAELNKAALTVDYANLRNLQSLVGILQNGGTIAVGDKMISISEIQDPSDGIKTDKHIYVLLEDGTLSNDLFSKIPSQIKPPDNAYRAKGHEDPCKCSKDVFNNHKVGAYLQFVFTYNSKEQKLDYTVFWGGS